MVILETGKPDSSRNVRPDRPALLQMADRASSRGTAQANLPVNGGQPSPLVFTIGTSGNNSGTVRVVIKDESGITVATMSLAGLVGTQNVIWTPRPGMAPGAFAAYWQVSGDA